MDLYFVRHGKTEWNEAGRFQGSGSDSPLLASSLLEVTCLAKEVQHIPFEAIYSSPILRARKTAEIIGNGLNLPVIFDSRLREIGMGQLEGVYIADAVRQYPNEMAALKDLSEEYDPSLFLGETYQSLIDRSLAMINEAVKQAKRGPLLFVSHGMTLQAIMQRLLLNNQFAINDHLKNNTLSHICMQSNGTNRLIMWNGIVQE